MSTATAETVTGLTDGVTYTFTVAAINAVGTGPDSTASTASWPHPPPARRSSAPPPPATAGNRVLDRTRIDGGSPITGYIVTPYVSGVDRAPPNVQLHRHHPDRHRTDQRRRHLHLQGRRHQRDRHWTPVRRHHRRDRHLTPETNVCPWTPIRHTHLNHVTIAFTTKATWRENP